MKPKTPKENKKSLKTSPEPEYIRYSEFKKLVVRCERLEKLFEQKVKTKK